jgi:hypothetical protein
MDKFDAIALVLASEKEPTLKEQPDFAEAHAMIDADPAMTAWLESEQAFYWKQEDLLQGFSMPEDARKRIQENFETVLLEEGELIECPSFGRNLLTLAAAVLILFAGAGTLLKLSDNQQRQSLIANSSIQNFDTYRELSSRMVAQGLSLDFQTNDINKAVEYLKKLDAPVQAGLDGDLLGLPAMGCAIFQVGDARVSLICMRTPAQEVVHLFAAPRNTLKQVKATEFTQIKIFNGRETRAWQDTENAYVLVAHNIGQRLGGG